MTVVIQQVDSRQYVAGHDEWVGDPHEALTFADAKHALRYCRHHTLTNVRLVVFFRDRKVGLLLYVPGSKTPAPAGALRAAT